MSSLSKLEKIVFEKKKRLGRGIGTGKGSKSGRGTTRHQAAREDIPLHFEGGQNRMVKRFPLLRGKFRNKPSDRKPANISLEDLNKFADREIVTLKALIEKGIIMESNSKNGVKILANGELKKSLNIELPVSKSAKLKIEKAGGKIK